MDYDMRTDFSRLKQGLPPESAALLDEITVGIQPFAEFLEEKYLAEYISKGGSKIKFVTGRPGSGKSHFLNYLSAKAKRQGFIAINFSAKNVWLHDFKEVYLEIYRRCDLMACLSRCAEKIILELGYDPKDVGAGMTFADYLSSLGDLDAITKKEIRNQLQQLFLKNPLVDNNFAAACSLLTGGILGHPAMEDSSKELLLGWLENDKEAKLAAVRKLGLSPSRITKYNARHMLRSLAEIHRIAGYPGFLVTVDDMGILAGPGPMDTIRYTKLKREDAYECIRELIDEIDTLKNIMFVFAFDRRLIDDELTGVKSYQALWMRIQNEIMSDRFNQFTDIIDLDGLGRHIYNEENLAQMSERLVNVANRVGQKALILSSHQGEVFVGNDQHATTALPRLVGAVTLDVAAFDEAASELERGDEDVRF